MPVSDVIAERRLICVKPDGVRVPVALRLGKPYPTGDDWACPVALEGLEARLPDVHGIDSFQALMLAQALQRQLMSYVIQDGGSFRTIEEDALVDLDKLFASGI